MNEQKPSLSYKDAGVDIDAGNALVQRIKTRDPADNSSRSPWVALVVLVHYVKFRPVTNNRYWFSGTDGVGNQAPFSHRPQKKHDTVGIDLVAMCVNDLIVQGGLSHYSFSTTMRPANLTLTLPLTLLLVSGEGCVQSGCALIGGGNSRNARYVRSR